MEENKRENLEDGLAQDLSQRIKFLPTYQLLIFQRAKRWFLPYCCSWEKCDKL